jgi:PAS domain S-box-containing protein
VFQDEVIGLIQVANKGTDYTKADIRSLETIAERIAPILSARLQRKRAEEEVSKLNAELEQRVLERTAQLRSARERLQFVLSATPAVIYTSKASGDYAATFISDNIAQLGYTPVEFLENPDFWVSHIHPDDAPRVLADLAHLFEHGHHIHEYRFRLKDGSYRWMRDELHLVRDEDGNPLETVGYWIDITERKQAEEALAASEGKYRGLYDSLRDGIVMVSMDGRITQCNRVYREMLGYTEEEVLRLTYQQLTPQKWHAMEAEIVRDQIVARGYSDEYEKEYIRKDGTAFPISLHVWLITDEQGETTGMWGIIRDITERKRAEDELRRLNRDLALRAAELDAVNQELEAFAYSVSHDLRSPLRVVDGYSKILLEDYCGKLDEDGRFMLGQVRESVHQMGQLIDDLLAFSRMSRREMTRRQCDIGAMARQVFRALREAHPNRRLALTVQPLPAAFGEPAMIREVLRNLLDNAVKFTATREEGVIEMGSMPIADGQSEIAYYVRDNGVGFDMRYRNKLFQVFQRLHRTEDFDGTGIGLALVARIVHRHGGRVWAEGEEDKGATFYFTLPRTADAEDKGLKTIGEERT